jgi:flagellar operon protein
MSLIDPTMLRGLRPVQGQKPTKAGEYSQETSHLFSQNLEALLQQEPANTPMVAPEVQVSSTDVQFSQHAKKRLSSRGIEIDGPEMQRLNDAVDQLAERGARESLVLMDDRAYVVGVPKRTVITAMSREEALGNVFTNIDSTFVAL